MPIEPQWESNKKGQRQVAVPGILGGLGPLAHIELEKRILQICHHQRGVRCDQDYPTWLVVSATQIPDRTHSLRENSLREDNLRKETSHKKENSQERDECLLALQHYARSLQTMGSDFLVVSCNTAHAFYGPVQAEIDIPWLHLMDVTTHFIRQQYPDVSRVGVLATDGTIKARLYANSLRKADLMPIEPAYGSLVQKQVMQSIYAPTWGIKTAGIRVSDRALKQVSEAAASLYAEGAEVIIAGCTELSIACAQLQAMPIPWVDPLDAIASSILTYAYGDRPLPLSGPALSGPSLSSPDPSLSGSSLSTKTRNVSPILNYAAL
ncbi:MAG: amino acid racemase [Cyanobacteria bacterium P01_D01_bin.105]